MKKTCKNCNIDMVVSLETANHSIFGEKIKITNVPVLKCSSCGKEIYENEEKVDHLVRLAYLSKQYEIDYTTNGSSH